MVTAKGANRNLADMASLCLGYLAENPEDLMHFMQFAGYDPGGLRSAVGTQALNAGLIDYFGSNEPLLLALCANTGTRIEDFMRVHAEQNRHL